MAGSGILGSDFLCASSLLNFNFSARVEVHFVAPSWLGFGCSRVDRSMEGLDFEFPPWPLDFCC